MILILLLIIYGERGVRSSVTESLGQVTSLCDEKDLAAYVNSFRPTKNGACHCDLMSLLCECSVRMKADCNQSTSYSVDSFTAALVVDSLNKENLHRQHEDDCSSQIPPEEKAWPPVTPFTYENKYLGQLTGVEEPVQHLRMFPSQPNKINTQFLLHQMTKINQDNSSNCARTSSKFSRIHYDNETSIRESVDRCDSLYFIIHGFRQTYEDDIFNDFRSNLLNYTTLERSEWINCVIGVDWRSGAQMRPLKGIMAEAAVNTITVGREVALLAYSLVVARKVAADNIHVIGFSLGAQVAHFAAVWFKQLATLVTSQLTKGDSCDSDWLMNAVKSTEKMDESTSILGRVTGLDPAAREFSTYPGSHLLASDATFVDIIHTSACEYSGSYIDVLNARFGMSEAVGSVDFYPNGGSAPQPECSLDRSNLGCSHNRAIIFFVDSLDQSIDSNLFTSTSCKSQGLSNSSTDLPTNKDQQMSSMGIRASSFAGRGPQYLTYTSKKYKKNHLPPDS